MDGIRPEPLKSHRSQKSHHSSRPHADAPGRRHGRHHPDAPTKPWQDMANTYAWVVEQEFVKVDRVHRTTEQWIFEQQIRFPSGAARQDIEERVRRRMWEEAMDNYELKTERWMRREEELRRIAVEREREKVKAVQEELRRLEARLRQGREAEKRRAAEQKQRERHEQKKRERREREEAAENAATNAWQRYETEWNRISGSSEPLAFADIPWPLVSAPSKPEDITLASLSSFLFSPVHSQHQTRKERIRNAQLRWHPDRFQRMMRRVQESEKDLVQEGVGIVARCLNDLMSQ